jgi:long-subunit acyl-CoA synthetase (AMP-forming)
MTTFYAASVGTDKNIKYMDMEGKENRFFSYLPLCHIAERAFVEGGSFTTGAVVYFAESLETFAQNLRDAQPTHFLAVPRIWTKFQMGILSKVPQKKLDRLLKIPILSTMVKNKIRKGLGLNKVRVAITAAAPMPAALLDWYKKLGLNIREAYGMTENGGACTVMPADKIKIGTVGKPYDYVQVKIDPQSKEILMKSDLLMTGYYREPYMTAEVLQNGWLHTGDMGEFDEEGYLKLTGRVKDLFKTAKGEYVVPGPIEWKFAINQDIEQICVVGTGLPQPIALIVLSDLAKAKPIEEIKKHLAEQIPHINRELVNYMQIKKVVIVREAWTTENGILTPTLKVKRNVLEAHYQSKIETWYEMADMVIEEGQ